jgi:hypothetical protein
LAPLLIIGGGIGATVGQYLDCKLLPDSLNRLPAATGFLKAPVYGLGVCDAALS